MQAHPDMPVSLPGYADTSVPNATQKCHKHISGWHLELLSGIWHTGGWGAAPYTTQKLKELGQLGQDFGVRHLIQGCPRLQTMNLIRFSQSVPIPTLNCIDNQCYKTPNITANNVQSLLCLNDISTSHLQRLV